MKLNPYCKAVEWWTKAGGLCFECTRPSWMSRYRDASDLANPPHVFIEKLGKIVIKDIIGRGCVSWEDSHMKEVGMMVGNF